MTKVTTSDDDDDDDDKTLQLQKQNYTGREEIADSDLTH
jgi:hypothetical protein